MKEAQDNSEPVLKDMPYPRSEDLSDPTFQAIWRVIKTWDINVQDHYRGYWAATGSHAMLILNEVRALKT
jgi:hypothetical protein